jgi:hypothetical protein
MPYRLHWDNLLHNTGLHLVDHVGSTDCAEQGARDAHDMLWAVCLRNFNGFLVNPELNAPLVFNE